MISPQDCQKYGLSPYLPSPELIKAVNLAIFLEKRPLLLKGEPGCGKTTLARAVAHELGLPYQAWYIKSTSRAKDGLYTYDAVGRLHDAQLARTGKASNSKVENLENYIKLGPLGHAFKNQQRTVVLIDEIDKADIDFPNDLLRELDEQKFTIEEKGSEVKANYPPIVFVTSNDEKDLPDAFLRRCLFYYIQFPLKQCWRYLRRPVRQGVPTELDVEATVAKIGREGILLQPVLMPPRINRTDLVLLIDQEGSMVPFHDLSRQLVQTAQRGGRLRTTNVFYFHDYPDEYLYRHPAMLDAKPVSEVFEEIGERAVVLIVSDAGAARGNFDQERVDNTRVWIEELQQSVRYLAWLNPMPSECWRQTTAGEVARFVPMFEMNSQGMNAAISVLRGRYIVVKELDESLCY